MARDGAPNALFKQVFEGSDDERIPKRGKRPAILFICAGSIVAQFLYSCDEKISITERPPVKGPKSEILKSYQI